MKFVFITALVALTLQSICVAADGPDLPTVRAAVNYYCSSISSLSGSYANAFLHKGSDAAIPNPTIMEGLVSEIIFSIDVRRNRIWTDDRSTWLHSKISSTAPFKSRTIRAFDGERSYFLIHTLSACPIQSEVPLERPYRLNISTQNELNVHFWPWHLAGIRTKLANLSLAELLARAESRLVGYDEIRGTKCAHVQVVVQDVQFDGWLDPGHSFLPLRQTFQSFDKSKPTFVIDTFDFGRFKEADRDAEHWFPIRGMLDHDIQSNTLIVHDITLNPPIDDSQFRIAAAGLPDGIQVNGPQGASYTGNQKEAWKQLDKLLDEETARLRSLAGIAAVVSHPQAASTYKPASAPSRYWIPLALGLFLIALVGYWRLVKSPI